MRHLDLFSGIGGFALAARWIGWETVGFCEIEDYPRAVLKKNFPGVPIHDDIHTLDARDLRVDLITGGFPCQPHSTAGLRRGRDDSRHLWPQFARIIAEARPAWVVIENVPGLRTTAADEVLADLESLGYACWPLVVGAVHAGAPHRRQRVWIVANASGGRLLQRQEQDLWPETGLAAPRWHDPERLGADAANAGRELLERGGANDDTKRWQRPDTRAADVLGGTLYFPDWRGWTDAPEPAIRGLAHGLPAWVAGCRVPALKALGNAIVPQVAYQIFRAIEAAA